MQDVAANMNLNQMSNIRVEMMNLKREADSWKQEYMLIKDKLKEAELKNHQLSLGAQESAKTEKRTQEFMYEYYRRFDQQEMTMKELQSQIKEFAGAKENMIKIIESFKGDMQKYSQYVKVMKENATSAAKQINELKDEQTKDKERIDELERIKADLEQQLKGEQDKAKEVQEENGNLHQSLQELANATGEKIKNKLVKQITTILSQ